LGFFLGKLCGFHLLGRNYLKLSPFLNSIVGNCFDYFLFFFNIGVLWHMFLKKINGFYLSKGSHVNLSPLLSSTMGNFLDHFPFFKIDVFSHICIESSVVFICLEGVVLTFFPCWVQLWELFWFLNLLF
jgi:hypothetical protein